MFAYRKADGAQFPCDARDVCRIEEGSTNPFLSKPRILEEFLRKIEPNYSRACDLLASGDLGSSEVLVLAGFVAFVIGCSPTAMRLGAESFRHLAHTEIELIERMEALPLSPPELGGKTATELLRDGTIEVETDLKYPQAMGIAGVVEIAKSFSTFHWEVLCNPLGDRFPFLTSDYPTAIEGLGVQIPAIRIVPLRPDLAIRIIPQIRHEGRPDLPTDFRYRMRRVSPSEVRKFNLSIVRSAENLVFSPVSEPWVARLVKSNALFRVELEHSRVPKGEGYLLMNSAVVREITDRKHPRDH